MARRNAQGARPGASAASSASLLPSRKIFVLLAVWWLIIMVVFITVQETAIRTGTQVLLKVAPIDPRDFFRGDYVRLGYDISTLNITEGDFTYGERVYVLLAVGDDDVASAAGLTKVRPSADDGLFIRGTVTETPDSWRRLLGVEYGIESYFVPEGAGMAWQGLRTSDLTARVIVGRDGRVILRELLVNGTVWKPSPEDYADATEPMQREIPPPPERVPDKQ